MKLRTLESGNLMPFFSYLSIEIAKINPSDILSRQIAIMKLVTVVFYN